MATTPQGHLFDAAAAEYAANRPSYPPELLDAVEELAGFPLEGARVADVGAGTGLATALLRDRGANVVAVEPGPGMAAQFRLGLPDIPLVIGDGDHLPLASASFDVLTYAQSWHWTDQRQSVPEALRVLRGGGALALWWNDSDCTAAWIADQDARLRRLFGAAEGPHDPAARFRGLPPELGFAHRHVPWSRTVPLDTHLANLASYSDFLRLGRDATDAFLAEERALLTGIFPDRMIEERYVVSLAVATNAPERA
ncbi:MULTISPECIES: class I SAM-dependent methyltransferase [Streptomyces]|uniref:Class I SAM-dependent methyltransferase n=1 Tax=Streptomyces sudanensis TaxID=436397 RepID=A0ABY4TGS3_9ACTN|nr:MULTISPECIES: class I SAM-dependent methyltransferase [Streptomyces]URN17420.1 class I SAM-dependent methyltransferase [Streptomyces sudanensis]